MKYQSSLKIHQSIFKKTALRMIISVSIIIFMGNLNALVDAVLHPEIPYFDEEHLIVGGITSLLCAFFLYLLSLYLRHLDKAYNKINTLESFLQICAKCKKVRKPGSDPKNKTSWQVIEKYITEKTTTKFSHGLCPDCATDLYSDVLCENDN